MTVLTPLIRQPLRENGYVHLPQVVPPEIRQAALKAINVSLGQNGMAPERLPEFRTQTFCPEVTRTAAITDLYSQTPVGGIVDALLGPGQVQPVGGGQIALRFPSDGAPGTPSPHIDGTYHPLNGVPEGEMHSFTALVAVFLTDVPVPNAGNFTVWPGSHAQYEQYFQEHGGEIMRTGIKDYGFVPLPEPHQITAQAGDAVIAHYLLAHSVAPNAWWQTRYAVFFRVKHIGHDEQKWDVLTDLWREWPGVNSQ